MKPPSEFPRSAASGWRRVVGGVFPGKLPLIAGIILLTAGFSPRSAPAQGATSPVRIEVKVTGGPRFDRIRGSNAMTTRDTKRLEILLSSVSQAPPAGVTARWSIYGRSVTGNTLRVLGSGTSPVTVRAGQTQTLLSDPITATSTPAHGVVTGRGRRGRLPPTKAVAAEGVRYAGYGVQVLQAGAVVAEVFSAPSLKEQAPRR